MIDERWLLRRWRTQGLLYSAAELDPGARGFGVDAGDIGPAESFPALTEIGDDEQATPAGLEDEGSTLQQIADVEFICRERVRGIINDSFRRLREIGSRGSAAALLNRISIAYRESDNYEDRLIAALDSSRVFAMAPEDANKEYL